MNKISIGKSGEDAAVAFLLDQGHSILERNFRNREGEVDIISQKKDVIYFSEVKTWAGNVVHPLETFSKKKILRMKRLASTFFYQRKWKEELFFVSFSLIFKNREKIEFYTNLF